jgi:Tfp pilus assembly protein PilO
MNMSSSNRVRIALIAVLVVAIAYLLVWRPRAAQVAELQDERDQMSQELAGFAAVDASPTPPAAGSTEALAVAIPPTDGLAELLRQFQSIASDTGVEQKTVAAQQPAPIAGTSGSSIPVTMTVSGPRAAALEYVRRLGVLPRLLVVDSMTIAPSTDAPDTAPGAGEAVDPTADHVQLDIAGRVFTTAAPTTEAING